MPEIEELDLDSPAPSKIDDLIAKACLGLGPKRLEKFTDFEATELAVKLGIEDPPDPSAGPEARARLDEAILKFKSQNRDKLLANAVKAESAKGVHEVPTRKFAVGKDAHPSRAQSPSKMRPGPPYRPVSETAIRQATFANRQKHELVILAFNSLKLRVNHEGLAEQWLDLVNIMSSVDVVLLSEVPAKEAKARTQQLVALMMMEQKDGVADEWSFSVSEPCGPGNPEVHVALVKRPIRVIETVTHTEANGVQLDHAPFSIKINDPRFSRGQTIIVTSVHFPPSSRSKDRDQQMNAFFKAYNTTATMRMNEPFTLKGAKDARKQPVAHIVAGDFNAYPLDRVPDLLELGWGYPLVGSQVATSAGRKSFDHFVPDAHTTESYNLSWEILQLAMPQNSSKGEIGLSDHDPIILTIKEATRLVSDWPALTSRRVTYSLSHMIDGEPITPHHFYSLGAGLIGPQVSEKPSDPTKPQPVTADSVTEDDNEPPPLEEDPDLVVVKAKEVHKKPDIPADAFDRPVLCFDTETAGFKPPAICQLAYQLHRDGEVEYYDKILQLPEGVKIHPEAAKKHGITDAMAAGGLPAGPELLEFWKLVQEVYEANGTVVGHNIGYDCNAFNVSAEKQGLTQELDKEHMFDTMKKSSSKSTLKNKAGHKKQFRLDELYEALYGDPPSWARLHNAADDVHVTIAAYYKGAQEGWW